MKNLLYKAFPICLLSLALAGCDEETKYRPLPEAVPLSMNLNAKAFVMGETMKVDIQVNEDAEGNAVVANEDFDIYFSAKAGDKDHSAMFDPFNHIVTFPKGEKSISIDFPVKKAGLEGTTAMELVAFARGYQIANSTQGIKVSDYYRVTISLENNTENVVDEGAKFVLVAKVDKPVLMPVEIAIAPKAGEEKMYENFPASITIPAGRTSAKSSAVTIKPDFEKTGTLHLVMNFTSSSNVHPMQNASLTIQMNDAESIADPNLFDPTLVYADPEIMFASYDDPWFVGKKMAKMKEGDAHPNPALASQWKFDYAIEFHKNETSGDFKKLGNASDASRGTTLKVDWNKYAKVTDEGELNLFVGYEGNQYATAAVHACKTLGKVWAQNVTRIYPGMRIEVKAKLGGDRTGFIPMIEVKNPASAGRDGRKSIVLLKNETGSAVTQLIKGEQAGHVQSVKKAFSQIEQYNIYWMEYVDENTIKLGINGSTTLEVTKDMMETWPFTKKDTGSNALGAKGLFLIMRWDLFGEQNTISPELQPGWDAALKQISPENFATQGPRMMIDWIRFYVNENYKREANEKVNRDFKQPTPNNQYYPFY